MAHSHPLHGDHMNIELFRYMCRLNRITDSGTLPFLVPDTVIFNNARATQWFSFDAESGTLGRRPSKQLDRQIIFQEFSQINKHDKSEICACFTTFHDCKLQSLYFTPKTLYSFLFGPSGGPSEELQMLTTIPASGSGGAGDHGGAGVGSGHHGASTTATTTSSTTPRMGILQKFIEPNKDNNEVFQVAWSPRMTYILRRYSKKRLIDRLSEPLARAATFDGPSTLSEEVYAGAGTKSVVEPFVKALVDHVRGADSGRYTVGRCLLFFKVDRFGQMWFLYCTSMRIIIDEEDRRNLHHQQFDNNNNMNESAINNNSNVDGGMTNSASNSSNNHNVSHTSNKRAGVDEYGQVKYQLHEPQFNFSAQLPTIKDLERLQIVPHIDSPLAAMLNLDEAKLQALAAKIQAKAELQAELAQRQQAQLAIAGGSSPVGKSSSPTRGGGGGGGGGGDDNGNDLTAHMMLSAQNNTNGGSPSRSIYSISAPASFPRRRNNEDMFPVHLRAKWDRSHLEQLHFNPPPVRPNLEPLILSLQRQENASGLDLSEAWDRSDDGANADHERLLYLLSLPGPLTKRELVRSRKVGQKGIVPPPGWEETREKLYPSKKKRSSSEINGEKQETNNNNKNNDSIDGKRTSPTKHFRASQYNTASNLSSLQNQKQQQQGGRPSSTSGARRNNNNIGDDSSSQGLNVSQGYNSNSNGRDSSSKNHRKILAGEGISASLLSRFLTPSIDRSVDQSNQRIDAMEAKKEEIRKEKEKIRQEMKRIGMKAPKKKENESTRRAQKNSNHEAQNDDDQHDSSRRPSARRPTLPNIHENENNKTESQELNGTNPPALRRPTSARKPSETVSADLALVNIDESFYLEKKVRNGMLVAKKKNFSNPNASIREQVVDVTEQLNDLYTMLISRNGAVSTELAVKEKINNDNNNHHTGDEGECPKDERLFVEAGMVSVLDERDPEQKQIYDDFNFNASDPMKRQFECRILIWYDHSSRNQQQSGSGMLKNDDHHENNHNETATSTTPRNKNNDSTLSEPAQEYDDDFDEMTPEKRSARSVGVTHLSPEKLANNDNNNNDNSTKSISSPLVTGSLRGQHPSMISQQNSKPGNNNSSHNGSTSKLVSNYGSLRSNASGASQQQQQQQISGAQSRGLSIFVSSGKSLPSLPPLTTFSDSFIMAFKMFAQSSLAATNRELKAAEQAVATISDSLLPLLVAHREAVRLESRFDRRRLQREETILSKNTKGDRDTQNETVAMITNKSVSNLNKSSTKTNASSMNEGDTLQQQQTQQQQQQQDDVLALARDEIHVKKPEAGWVLDYRICTAAFNAGFAVLKYEELLELERVSHEVAQRHVVEVMEDDERIELNRDEDMTFMDLHQLAWKDEIRIQTEEERKEKEAARIANGEPQLLELEQFQPTFVVESCGDAESGQIKLEDSKNASPTPAGGRRVSLLRRASFATTANTAKDDADGAENNTTTNNNQNESSTQDETSFNNNNNNINNNNNSGALERRNSMWKNYDPGRRSSVFAPVDNNDIAALSSRFDRDEEDDDENKLGVEVEDDGLTKKKSNKHLIGGPSSSSSPNSKQQQQQQQRPAVHIVIQVIDPLLADRHSSSLEGRMALRRFCDEALSSFRLGVDQEQKRYEDIVHFFGTVRSEISQAGGIVTPRTRAANEKVQQQVLLQQQISAKEVHLMPAPHGPYHVLIPGVPRSAADILLNPKKASSLGANLSVAAAAKGAASGGSGSGGGGGGNAASKNAAAVAEAIARKNAAPARRGGMTKAELRQFVAVCTFRSLFGTLEEFRRRYKNYHLHVNSNFCYVYDAESGVVVLDDGKKFGASANPNNVNSQLQQQQQGRSWSEEVVFKSIPAQALAVQITSLQQDEKTWWCRRC